jgi:hypothetical protein
LHTNMHACTAVHRGAILSNATAAMHCILHLFFV